jgi:hypothetical protein
MVREIISALHRRAYSRSRYSKHTCIGSVLHVLLGKHNRVRFNEEGAFIAIADEAQSMVGTVFGKLARHPAVLQRITRHPYYHNDRIKDAHEAAQVPAKEIPEDMIDGIVRCT